MATYSGNNAQATNEVRTYTIDYSNDLPTGGTIASGTAFHTPPSGTAVTPTCVAASPFLYVTVPALTVVGNHYVDALATFSDGEKSAARVAISVLYPTATARPGMSNLISTLRSMANTGLEDYTIANVPYWSDAQLQTVLDRYAAPIRDEPLQAIQIMSGGTVNYFDYQSNSRFFEATTGGSAVFVIRDIGGTAQGTANWSADYERGLISFAADTKGTGYFLTGRSYDVYAAAADVWYQKAAHASEMIDFSTDGHSIKRAHVATMCMKMAQRYESMASVSMSTPVELVRGDMA